VNWGSLDGFFHMGGYGLYVWGSYGVAALCIALELIALRVRARRLDTPVPGRSA
jgi:heme exporter protein D